jgi:hypothetical protein
LRPRSAAIPGRYGKAAAFFKGALDIRPEDLKIYTLLCDGKEAFLRLFSLEVFFACFYLIAKDIMARFSTFLFYKKVSPMVNLIAGITCGLF